MVEVANIPKKFDRSVSLLCWAYNEENLIQEYLERATRLIENSVEDFEIVLIDDGSTDRTYEIAAAFQEKNPRLKIFRNEKNLNVGISSQRAIQRASKEFLFWQTIDWSYDISNLRSKISNLYDLPHPRSFGAFPRAFNLLIKEKKNHPIVDKFTIKHTPTGKTGKLNPTFILAKIREATPTDSRIVSDVGQNQMWVAQHYHFNKFNTHFSSGGLGTMGFAVPAATGIKAACPDKTVWAICGDGGFQMTFQHLGIISQESMDIKIALFNNGYLGMVRQWQELFYDKNYEATPLLNPNFSKIAEAYEIPYLLVEKPEQVSESIQKALTYKGTFILEFIIEQEKNVFPMVPAGKGLSETRFE